MNNQQFYNSFFFTRFTFDRPKHTDNVSNGGASHHYIGQLLHGRGKLVAAAQSLSLQEGDIFYIPKGLQYHSYWETDSQGLLQWNSIGFTCFPDPGGQSYLLQTLTVSSRGMDALGQISSHLGKSVENIGLLYRLLADVLPHMLPDSAPAERLVQKVTAALQADPHTKIEQLARLCNVSQSSLYDIFRKQLGITPNTLRQQLLCEKARELLVTTNLSVEQISSRLGFSSSSYFRKVLRKHTKRTPLQLRKENDLQSDNNCFL